MYSIKPDIHDPGAFMLMRQESSNLDAQKFLDTKKIRAYELAHGIRSFSMQFIYEPSAQEEREDDGKSKQSAKQDEQMLEEKNEKKQVKRYRTATSWSSNELVQKPGSALVPSYVRIKAEFTSSNYPLDILIPVDGPGMPNRVTTAQPSTPPPAQTKPAPASTNNQTGKKPQPVVPTRGARR